MVSADGHAWLPNDIYRVFVLIKTDDKWLIYDITAVDNPAHTKAAAAELAIVQAAVDSMMTEEGLSTLPDPVTMPTSNMMHFPDWESSPNGGYVLIPTDAGNDKNTTDTDWISTPTTTGTYWCTSTGTVKQATTGYDN